MMNRIKTTLAILGLLLALSVEAQVVLDKRTKQPIPGITVRNSGYLLHPEDSTALNGYEDRRKSSIRIFGGDTTELTGVGRRYNGKKGKMDILAHDSTDVEGRIHIPLVGKETILYGRNYKYKSVKTKQILSDSIIYLKPEFNLDKTPSSAERTPRKRRGYTLMTGYYRVYEKCDSLLIRYYDGFVYYLIPASDTKPILGRYLDGYGLVKGLYSDTTEWLVVPFWTTKTLKDVVNQKGWKYRQDRPASDLVRDGRFGGEVRIDSLAREVTMEYDCKLAGEPVFDTSDDWAESRIAYFQSKGSLRLLQSFIRESYWYQDSLSNIHFDNLINRYKYNCFWFRNKESSEDEKIEVTQELYTLSTKHISKLRKFFLNRYSYFVALRRNGDFPEWARVYKFVPPMDSVTTSPIPDRGIDGFPCYYWRAQKDSIFYLPRQINTLPIPILIYIIGR
jgi:hypothetical protein